MLSRHRDTTTPITISHFPMRTQFTLHTRCDGNDQSLLAFLRIVLGAVMAADAATDAHRAATPDQIERTRPTV
jgi:hypothetical protein